MRGIFFFQGLNVRSKEKDWREALTLVPRSKGWGMECSVCKISKRNNLEEGTKGLCLFFFLIVFVILTFTGFIVGRLGGVYLKFFSWAKRTPAPFPLKRNKYLKIFIYLAVPVLVTELGIFDHCLKGTLSCGMRSLVSWPGLKLRPLHGARSLSHLTTGEVPSSICICVNFVSLRGFEFPMCI